MWLRGPSLWEGGEGLPSTHSLPSPQWPAGGAASPEPVRPARPSSRSGPQPPVLQLGGSVHTPCLPFRPANCILLHLPGLCSSGHGPLFCLLPRKFVVAYVFVWVLRADLGICLFPPKGVLSTGAKTCVLVPCLESRSRRGAGTQQVLRIRRRGAHRQSGEPLGSRAGSGLGLARPQAPLQARC